jgi:hypothetical protein
VRVRGDGLHPASHPESHWQISSCVVTGPPQIILSFCDICRASVVRGYIADLFEWLGSPPMPWVDFFAYREEMKPIKEQVRREQAWEQWKAFQELSRKLGRLSEKPEVCPSCDSHLVIPIAYGAPDEPTAEAARRGAVSLGGCVLKRFPKWCCRECNYCWPKEGDDEA